MCWSEWLKDSEPIAVWLEGIALVFIFGLELREFRRQGRERQEREAERIQDRKDLAAQMEIWRKQIHADRVAQTFEILREFTYAVSDAIMNGTFGVGANMFYAQHAPIYQKYMAVREAHYISKLISEPLAAYVWERVEEMEGLQRVADHQTFNERLTAFHQNWNGDIMAAKFRELS
jgi:hypothetical protein